MTRFAMVLLLLVGCTSKPAEIRIKGPRDAVESTRASPSFAPFERKGDTLRLRASAFDDRGRYLGTVPVDWQSSDRGVATVSQTGVVTFLSSGKVSIQATTKSEPKRSATLSLEARIVKNIRIAKPKLPPNRTLTLAMGEAVELVAEVLDDRGRVMSEADVRWRTTSYAATVSRQGVVLGRAIGTGQIIAEAKNGASTRVDVRVRDWAKKRRQR